MQIVMWKKGTTLGRSWDMNVAVNVTMMFLSGVTLTSAFAPSFAVDSSSIAAMSDNMQAMYPSLTCFPPATGIQTRCPSCRMCLQQTKHDEADSASENDDASEKMSIIDSSGGIPTIEQLQTDGFMQQVRHAEFIVGLLHEDAGRETRVLMRRLEAQLSHPDGIRGFMVTFLTAVDNVDVDNAGGVAVVPRSVVRAVMQQIDPRNDSNELISLMCMNIIMPTAMTTTHPQGSELSEQSRKTAQRAVALVQAVLAEAMSGQNNNIDHTSKNAVDEAIRIQCRSIVDAGRRQIIVPAEGSSPSGTATTTTTDDTTAMWCRFFEKWGYKEKQLIDITDTVQSIID